MNPARAAALGFATPSHIGQAPDYSALGFSTQPYDGFQTDEQKVGLAVNPSLFCHRIARGVNPPQGMQTLPTFALGEVPTYNRQLGSDETMRGKIVSMLPHDSRMLSGDLVYAFAAVENRGRYVPGGLPSGYEGSPFNYGSFTGLPPSHITGGSFVAEYADSLSKNTLEKRVEQLIREGHDEARVRRVMEQQLDDDVRRKLSSRT